jgi:NAD(P)-dependent dehydrogenase (short-subunit alcohol dehydrogenase family)
MADINSYNIVLTGANRGLGYFLCTYLLQHGHSVYALLRKENRAVLALKREFEDNLVLLKADVTDQTQLRDAFHRTAGSAAAVDILINNAAVHLEPIPPDLEEIDFSVYAPTFEVNAIAPLKVIAAFLPLVRKGKRRLIVNISSEAGSIADAWREREYAYCMSKAALNMASKILQNRLGKEDIKVLALHPGWFSSDMGGSGAPITPEEAALKVGRTILQDWHGKDIIYLDSDEKQLPW